MNIVFEDEKNQFKSQKLAQNLKEIRDNNPEDERINYENFETESQIYVKEMEIKRSNDSKQFTNKEVLRVQDHVSDLSSEDDEYEVLIKPPYHHIIIDFSSVTYIDTFAVKTVYRVNIIYFFKSIIFCKSKY